MPYMLRSARGRCPEKMSKLRISLTGSSGHKDRQRFPEEMLVAILGHVSAGEDVSSCLHTCTTFERILYPERATRLFDGVVLQNLHKFLDKSSLLKCRLVCRAWRHAVDDWARSVLIPPDDFFDTDPTSAASIHADDDLGEDGEDMLYQPYLLDYIYFFSTSEKLTEFLNNAAQGHSLSCSRTNPFITRKVGFADFRYTDSDKLLQFWNLVAELLTKHGQHIREATFVVGSERLERSLELICSHLLLRIVPRMPHLDSLQIYANQSENRWRVDRVGVETFLRELETLLPHTFPNFCHLKMLVLPIVPAPLMNMILDSVTSNELQMLFLGPSYGNLEENLYHHLAKWPNIPLKFFNSDSVVWSLNSLQHLTPDTRYHLRYLRLSKIMLNVTPFTATAATSQRIPSFYRLIEEFNSFPNVKHLSFGISVDDCTARMKVKVDRCYRTNLKLNQLTELHLRVWDTNVKLNTIDFVRTCTTLKNLKVTVPRFDKRKRTGQSLQLNGFASHMKDSSIWTKLPHLNYIQLLEMQEPTVTWEYFRP